MKAGLRIRHKVILLLTLPLLAYLFSSITFLFQKFSEQKILVSMNQNLQVIEKISSLILNLQKERGLTYSYLNGSQEAEFKMRAQRQKTSQAFEEFQSKINAEQKNYHLNFGLQDLDALRNFTDQKAKDPLTIFLTYSLKIESLISIYVQATNEKTTRGTGKILSAIELLEEAKEHAGRFRGLSSGILARNTSLSEQEMSILVNSYAGMKGLLNFQGLLVSDSSLGKVRELKSGGDFLKLGQNYQVILNQYHQGNFNLSSQENFETGTRVIAVIQAAIENELNILKNTLQQFIRENNEEILSSILILSFIFLFSLTASYFLARSITRPLSRVSSSLESISQGEGDLTARIEISSKDEAGQIGYRFNLFVEKLQILIENLKKQSDTLHQSSQDLSANAEQASASVEEITASADSTLTNTQNEQSLIVSSGKVISDMIQGIGEIDRMTEEMKNQVSQASSAIEEMAANISSSAQMATQASSSSENLEKVSQQGKSTIQTLNHAIEEVSKNSSQIVEMVQLIMDISEQTNLLAMNAAIEAAHAGEYGKGFAVVAEEIRKLADKSGKSAKEIQSVVKTISDSIQGNLQLSNQARDGFMLLGNEVARVKQVNHEISASMEEQKIANQSILNAANQLNRLSEAMFEKLKQEVTRGKTVNQTLEKVSMASQEIKVSMEEQKLGLDEASKSSEQISVIAMRVKEVAQKIHQDFNKFKTR